MLVELRECPVAFLDVFRGFPKGIKRLNFGGKGNL
jgi:hypothetical protein